MNRFIKHYSQFINEGAQLVAPNFDKVELSWLDDPKKPLEVLKSNNAHNVTGFRKVGTTSGGSFQVYYGLTVDPKRNIKLGNEDPLFKLTLDELKKSNIVGSKKAISDFVNRSANEILAKKGAINYVVSLGSTAGLSQDLAQVFKEKFKGSTHISLDKVDFDNFGKALNWDYLKNYDIKVKEEGVKPILKRVKDDIIKAIDLDQTSPEIIQSIRNATSADELQVILLKGNPNYRYHQYSEDDSNIISWKAEPFNIRSSGISTGGSRAMLKTKYDTPKQSGEFGDPVFMEAVKECILGGSTMLFVDDNSRTKEDLSKIFDSIKEIADAILLDVENKTNQMDQYHKRFLAYVLIYLPEPRSTGDANDIQVKKLASADDVNGFKDGGLKSISDWIEENKKK